MKIRTTITTATLLATLLTCAPHARATDLVTPLVSVGDTGSALCNVLNASKSQINVNSLQLLDSSGQELTSVPPFALAPGRASNVGFSTNVPTLLYCKVSVSTSKRMVRVSILVNDESGTSMVGFPAQ